MGDINYNRIIVKAVASIEILIGLAISSVFFISSFFGHSGRPKAVYGFVIITSLISIIIGAGLLRHRVWARKTLIFFSGYVILTKFLIASGLVTFTGNTMIGISVRLKDMISFAYHAAILIVFNMRGIKKELE